jgi:hypothetical protein
VTNTHPEGSDGAEEEEEDGEEEVGWEESEEEDVQTAKVAVNLLRENGRLGESPGRFAFVGGQGPPCR